MSDPFEEALVDNIRRFTSQMQADRARFIAGAANVPVGIGVPPHQIRDALENLIPKIPTGFLADLVQGPPQATPAPITAPGNVSPRGETLLAKAAVHRGLPYTWGGDGVSTFDCSALTQRAAGDIGIHIGRTTYEQIKAGYEVNWGQREIGDLVFSRFSDTDGVWETPEHVSIWAGNGKVLEAGNPIDYYTWGDRGTVRVRRVV